MWRRRALTVKDAVCHQSAERRLAPAGGRALATRVEVAQEGQDEEMTEAPTSDPDRPR